MKFIAHRGACLEYQEDTLPALERGADYGAYAVECDPRYTSDGRLVIFHDNDLKRLADDERRVDELTYEEMKASLAGAGKTLNTFDEIITGFSGRCPVLFDLSFNPEDDVFFRELAASGFNCIVGVHDPKEAELAGRHFDKNRILAFMRRPENIEDYVNAGAGILRLWEQWLPEFSVAEARQLIPADRQIWIMSCDKSIKHPLFCMNSSEEQVEKLTAMGVDGILLNDIAMAARFM